MGESNTRRHENLERRIFARVLTRDELVVDLLDLLRRIAANPDRDETTQRAAAASVAEIETKIRQHAARRACPDPNAGPAHRDVAILENNGYVPALTPEGERDGPETPRLMDRRKALWERPEIVALFATM